MAKNQFKIAREKKGLSQTQLAAKSEVSARSIWDIESGRYGNVSTLQKVAKALNKKVTIILE